ncbi:flagellar export protein FliJ [Nitratireductor mangrovi]|uniref:Flagellar export protein FliJ n=1 Tax=Nitratireductor mangrovi TaxID=2599600 RepID=A0A5B8L5Z6_9HYPH|nr:flagellar export protein FliJ [Nitratireductor mangrovi]QDZ03279.1 flagellar export protein FliJ [Nitratireductor mangrovi]
MKSRANLVRLKQFKVNEVRRQLTQLEMMIAEFDRMAAELDAQIQHEEKKSGITDTAHFAYPTFAKAARQRRDNLTNSRLDLIEQKANAEAALAEAEGELAKAEQLETRDARVREAETELRRAIVG